MRPIGTSLARDSSLAVVGPVSSSDRYALASYSESPRSLRLDIPIQQGTCAKTYRGFTVCPRLLSLFVSAFPSYRGVEVGRRRSLGDNSIAVEEPRRAVAVRLRDDGGLVVGQSQRRAVEVRSR